MSDSSALEALTVEELDDHYGDLEDYPKSATKAEKIAFIVAASDETAPPEEDEEESAPVAGEDYPVGELIPLTAGAWVRLADSPKVQAAGEAAGEEAGEPVNFAGHIARVTWAEISNSDGDDFNPNPHQKQSPDAKFTVVTRDEHDYVIDGLTRADFTAFDQNARANVEAHG